jgi:tRNA C32,U32 (ribose-2'-O)-methylase TrmJ
MNLGQAVAIVLYELIAHEPTPQAAPEAPGISAPGISAPGISTSVRPLATAGERERLTALLLEALSFNGYAHRATHAEMEGKIRRLVRHLELTPPDLREWLGLLRQLLWKLRATDVQSPNPVDHPPRSR